MNLVHKLGQLIQLRRPVHVNDNKLQGLSGVEVTDDLSELREGSDRWTAPEGHEKEDSSVNLFDDPFIGVRYVSHSFDRQL